MRRTLRELVRTDADLPAIAVDGLTETFRLYHERPAGLKERLYRLRRSTYTDFNALEDVSFAIEHGESVAVIGRNGSGKSTLLKVLARILPPDVGRVTINGRLASLLELGAGFHGDLTGRENIYLNGAILGRSRAEIDQRFDDIVDFAGIRPLLDTPVRTYSSGLYVRLGFAIAVTVDPDILLVDEVLSVGDARFQERSLARMRRFVEDGKTVVVVGHDLDVLAQLCDRALVLDHGRVAYDGPVAGGVALYRQLVTSVAAGPPSRRPLRGRKVAITDVSLSSPSGEPVHAVAPSSPLVMRVDLEAVQDVDACAVAATFTRGDGTHLHEVNTAWQGVGIGPLEAGQVAAVDVRFTAHLLAGHYRITPSVTDANGRETWAVVPDGVRFQVTPAPGGAGLVDLATAVAVAHGPALRLGGDTTTTGPLPVVRLDSARERRAAESASPDLDSRADEPASGA